MAPTLPPIPSVTPRSPSPSGSRRATVTTTVATARPCSRSTASRRPPRPGKLNTSFPFTRDVYSVVSLARLQNTSDPLHALLDGTSSFVCKDGGEIASYGFAQLGAACGEIIASLTAQP